MLGDLTSKNSTRILYRYVGAVFFTISNEVGKQRV